MAKNSKTKLSQADYSKEWDNKKIRLSIFLPAGNENVVKAIKKKGYTNSSFFIWALKKANIPVKE